jgi:peptidoglycan hydrolase-like protein with peptidoglycan-binding domain
MRVASNLAVEQVLGNLEYYVGSEQLSLGTTGESVKELQSFLGLVPNGNYDENLSYHVSELQKKLNIEVTGIYGSEIIQALKNVLHA